MRRDFCGAAAFAQDWIGAKILPSQAPHDGYPQSRIVPRSTHGLMRWHDCTEARFPDSIASGRARHRL